MIQKVMIRVMNTMMEAHKQVQVMNMLMRMLFEGVNKTMKMYVMRVMG